MIPLRTYETRNYWGQPYPCINRLAAGDRWPNGPNYGFRKRVPSEIYCDLAALKPNGHENRKCTHTMYVCMYVYTSHYKFHLTPSLSLHLVSPQGWTKSIIGRARRRWWSMRSDPTCRQRWKWPWILGFHLEFRDSCKGTKNSCYWGMITYIEELTKFGEWNDSF